MLIGPNKRVAKAGGGGGSWSGFRQKFRKIMMSHIIKTIVDFKFLFLCARLQENLEVITNWKEKSWVMYIWGGKSYLTLVHNFTNHTQHFVKLIDHILILALITHHVNLLPSSYNSYVFQWLSLGWKESEKNYFLMHIVCWCGLGHLWEPYDFILVVV